MTQPIDENPWIAKNYRLCRLLLFSVAINIGLLATFVYQKFDTVGSESLVSAYEEGRASEETNASALEGLLSASTTELLQALHDTTLLQDGYSKRDFAMSCLAYMHHYDVDKALGGTLIEKKVGTFLHKATGETLQLPLYGHLDAMQWEQVHQYLALEPWPLTPKGMFLALKVQEDPLLKQAFFATPVFCAMKTYFSRICPSITPEEVWAIMACDDGSLIACFMQGAPLSLSKVREVWMQLVRKGSGVASRLWIEGEGELLLRKTHDQELMDIIAPLDQGTLPVVLFLKQILCGVRSDVVCQCAGLKLYELAHETPPDPYDHNVALSRFLRSFLPEGILPAAPVPITEVTITVQEGDSLWKLARKHKTSIHAIRERNALRSDVLAVGRSLYIPLNSE